jgi:hypothetical protein
LAEEHTVPNDSSGATGDFFAVAGKLYTSLGDECEDVL